MDFMPLAKKKIEKEYFREKKLKTGLIRILLYGPSDSPKRAVR